MASVVWDRDVADSYEIAAAAMFDPAVVDPVVDALADLAAGGPALEFAIGSGRIALPLAARGVRLSGIELSPHMLAVLRAKDGAAAITAVLGDMKATRLGGDFSLVYLVFNTIMNVTTQDEQVAVFQNAAAHLRRGGRFVVEVIVPQVHRVAAGAPGLVSDLGDEHVGIDTFEDVDSQITWSHHWTRIDGRWLRHSAPYRYVWPAELELMARLTGFRTSQRWSDWTRRAFAPDSPSLIAVFEKG